MEEFAGAGAHGGGAGADGGLEKFGDKRADGGVLLGKVPEALQGKGFDNRAAVVEISGQMRGDSLRFRDRELQPRDHHRQVPADLLLCRLLYRLFFRFPHAAPAGFAM